VRVVYLNPCGKLGGAETSLWELLRSLRAAEPAWDLWLVLGEDGPLAGIARELGVQVVVQPFPPALGRLGDAGGARTAWRLLTALGASYRYAGGLRRLLRRLQPDIIHTNGFKMHVLAAWIRHPKTPLVWHIHDYVSSRRLMSRLLRQFRGACTVAIVNSKSVAQDLARVLPDFRIVPVYNAIDLQRFSPAGNKLDLDGIAKLTPPPGGTIRVGLIATFARWKGHKIFLEALARVPADLPIRGYVIGGPIYQTAGSQWSKLELEQESDRLRLGNRLGFTGFIENVPAVLRSLDIVVHASTSPEPFGMVIVEAMACGKPVIASQAGGAAELFVDGENALGHPPEDAEALARQIVRLAGDAQLRRTVGQAGRATVERLFHGKRMVQEVVAVYHGACGEAIAGTVTDIVIKPPLATEVGARTQSQ
jgi:glycosyltransferase involved in cell wall biosynthesis